jgi:hypothetical protein
MKIKFFLLIILLAAFTFCKRSSLLNGYSIFSNGVYFKLLAFGDGQENTHSNDVMIFDASIKTLEDSVFWQSHQASGHAFIINLKAMESDTALFRYFKQLTEGDSVSIMLNPQRFFRLFFDTIPPDFTAKDSLLIIDLKLNQFVSNHEFQSNYSLYNSFYEDKELPELKMINDFLLKANKDVIPDEQGIYWIEHDENSNELVSYGKIVSIELKGSFLNGTSITSDVQKMTFAYGTPDQVVKGLNIVIARLKKGEIAKIILPSRLAFGEKGSSNGAIPPYTPLIYEIKITEIK